MLLLGSLVLCCFVSVLLSTGFVGFFAFLALAVLLGVFCVSMVGFCFFAFDLNMAMAVICRVLAFVSDYRS